MKNIFNIVRFSIMMGLLINNTHNLKKNILFLIFLRLLCQNIFYRKLK